MSLSLFEKNVARFRTLHDEIAQSHPSLMNGKVWCRHCGTMRVVDPAECLRSGWPKCCRGETMSIDDPKDAA